MSARVLPRIAIACGMPLHVELANGRARRFRQGDRSVRRSQPRSRRRTHTLRHLFGSSTSRHASALPTGFSGALNIKVAGDSFLTDYRGEDAGAIEKCMREIEMRTAHAFVLCVNLQHERQFAIGCRRLPPGLVEFVAALHHDRRTRRALTRRASRSHESCSCRESRQASRRPDPPDAGAATVTRTSNRCAAGSFGQMV